MGLTGDFSRHLLLDPEFWRPRLERLAREPRGLALFPRPDRCRPGIEVVELRLRAHDGERLSALLARSAFASSGLRVHVRACGDLGEAPLDWAGIEAGASDLVLCYPPGRRLEDRVLDLLRVVGAVCSIESVGCEKITFCPSGTCIQDEFVIAEFLRKEGWIPGLSEGSR
jgi:hypothetical protein